MATPKPKLLPRVKYEPTGGDAGAGGKGQEPRPAYNPMNYYNPMQRIQPPAQEVGQGQYAVPYTPPADPAFNDPNGASGGMRVEMNAGQPIPPQGTASANVVPQSALTNNRANYAAAQSSGDTANMARLDAEWKRIQPLAAQYGISAQRLVNSYMQPGNSAAKGDLGSALAAAISDDVWAKEATNAFGRPPNQLEWDEHFRAMNFGGRDPLEGHPQSVENIKNAMNNIGQANQNQSYAQYSQWLAGQ